MTAKIQPVAFLLGRIALGAVFVAHGWQKWSEWGIDGTAAAFEGMGVPAPQLSAYFAATVELVGGALLILGALLPVVGVLLAADMLGALFIVHLEAGFWSAEGGYEFVLTLAAAALVIGFSGGGALAVDRLFGKRGEVDQAEAEKAEQAA